MRSFAPLAFAAISGVVIWKLFTLIMLPALGLLAGLLGMTLKFALIAGVAFAIYSMIRRRREARA
jgi:hypothetical protein